MIARTILLLIIPSIIIMIIILYTIIRYYSHTTRPQPSEDNHNATGHFILEDIFTPRENTDYNDFVTNHEKEDIIEKTNILLLRMIFSEKRDVIKGNMLKMVDTRRPKRSTRGI